MPRFLRFLVLPLVISTCGAPHAFASTSYLEHWWKDSSGETQHFGVTVDDARMRQAMTNSRDMLGFEQIRSKVMLQAQTMALQISTPTAKLKLRSYGQTYELSSTYQEGHMGEATALSNRVRNYIDGAYDDLGDSTYYTYDKDRRELVINYEDIILDFRDVIEATHQYFQARDTGKTHSAMINDRLNFLQSIRYNDLKSDPFGMYTPIRMLVEKSGDCESKQTYMAGMLKMLYPNRDVYLVLLPDKEHIVAAIEMPEAPDALTYYKDGRRYLIVDATGPSLVNVADTKILREKWDFDFGKQIWYPIHL